MKKMLSVLVMALVALLIAGGAAADEKKGTWVSDDGHRMAIHAAAQAAMFIGDDGGESFDLSDLADGESRVFGEGDKQITATRVGEAVTIIREAGGDERALEVICTVDKDTCQVITFDENPEKVMIVVQKTRKCVNGVGDCDATIDLTLDCLGGLDGGKLDCLGGLDGGKLHTIMRKVICDDEGNCETTEDIHSGHPRHGEIKIIADFDGTGPHRNVMFLADDAGLGQVMLRCPEGDSTVHVETEEAEDTFLCPKHSVPMTKVAQPHFIQKIRVHEDD